MEPKKKIIIQTNLDKLVGCTTCSEKFLCILVNKDVLRQIDLEEVLSIVHTEGHPKAALRLYQVILRRKNSFDSLVQALQESHQEQALKLLSRSDCQEGYIVVPLEEFPKLNELSPVELPLIRQVANLTFPQFSQAPVIPLPIYEVVGLSHNIFVDMSLPHVFLFNLENNKATLALLLNNYVPEELLTTQYRLISNRFLLADNRRNTLQLVHKKTKGPVVSVGSRNGTLFVVKWVGCGLASISKFLRPNKNVVFHAGINLFANGIYPTVPITISGGPGVGKSSLLVAFGKEVRQRWGDAIVFYVPLGAIPNTSWEAKEDYDTYLKWAWAVPCMSVGSRYLSSHGVSADQLRQLFESGRRVALMFDDFNTIPLDYQEEAVASMQALAERYRKVNLFITTVPELLPSLQALKDPVDYKIIPWDPAQQVSALTEGWRWHGASYHKLIRFAEECCRQLEVTNLGTKVVDIVGLPLQLKMISEIFKEGAREYSNPDMKLESVTDYFGSLNISISSLTKLFQSYITKRIKREGIAEMESNEAVIQAHIVLALKYLYPRWAPKLVTSFLGQQEDVEDIRRFGFVKGPTSSFSSPVQFVNRAVADYFVALFIHGVIKKNPSSLIQFSEQLILKPNKPNKGDPEFVQFLLQAVLQTTPKSVYIQKLSMSTRVFCNRTLVYFVNSLLSSGEGVDGIAEYQELHKLEDLLSLDKLTHCFTALLAADCFALFKILDSLTPASIKSSMFSKNPRVPLHLLSLCVHCCSTSTLQGVTEWVEMYDGASRKKWKFVWTLLKIAVERGSASNFDFLLTFLGKKRSLRHSKNKVVELLAACVQDSMDDEDEVVQSKKKIIKALAACTVPSIWAYCNNSTSPLLQRRVHLQLLQFMIECGAGVNVLRWNGSSLLHQVLLSWSSKWSSEELASLLETLFVHQFHFINVGGNVLSSGESTTALHLALQRVTGLTPEILELFEKLGADFRARDAWSQSIFETAEANRSRVGGQVVSSIRGKTRFYDCIDVASLGCRLLYCVACAVLVPLFIISLLFLLLFIIIFVYYSLISVDRDEYY